MIDRLINGVVLAELGGYGDGPYAAQHGAGAALVMLGTYIVDGRERVPYPPAFVFKPGCANYAGYLAEHIAAARASGALVGVSVVSVDLADSVDFLHAAEEAGADCVSLCAHSTMQMFVSAGVSSALCRRENWPSLQQWARALGQAVRIPLIFKIGTRDTSDTLGAVEVLAAAGRVDHPRQRVRRGLPRRRGDHRSTETPLRLPDCRRRSPYGRRRTAAPDRRRRCRSYRHSGDGQRRAMPSHPGRAARRRRHTRLMPAGLPSCTGLASGCSR